MAQVGEVEIGSGHGLHDARTVQKVRVALRVRQDRRGFPVRLAQEAVVRLIFELSALIQNWNRNRGRKSTLNVMAG
ncbi:hypothetical protein ROLI_029450 [Roseobacter fucihabitans]|uniref:Transposase n=1 Tax=Roseobacter fucihabitans TaxID=1537242 RepID=A0ABZ2BV11_9RHOB|nr:hypothetical protein [Roseobacter litoralis]